MTLLEKIDRLKKEQQLNNRQLSIQSGIPYTTIDGFYKVGFENMRLPTFIKLCDFFGVTMDSMAYDDREIEYKTENNKTLSKVERDLLKNFAGLDERGQLNVLDTAAREVAYIKEEDIQDRTSTSLSDAG